MTDDIAAIAAKLSATAITAFKLAKLHDDGDFYAATYSVPDRFTKAYRVYGRGVPLNSLGLAVRDYLTSRREE